MFSKHLPLSFSTTLVLSLVLCAPVSVFANTYKITDNISGTGFLSAFSWQAISDPTHGRVNYISQSTALSKNLSYAHGDTFIMRADSTTKLSASGPGRDSVRIQSNKQYSTHVAVFDIRHMPQGCGTWPAVWEVGDNWPNGGEVDVVEGVNDVSPNQSTLHTSPGCTMPASRTQTGVNALNDCNVNVNSNAGCGVKNNKASNYGPAFNTAGGGWYIVERTSTYIKVFFWGRKDGNVPSEIKNGAASVDTGNWGRPIAYFPSSSTCNLASKFAGNNIIINLTFCGDWAGNVYGSSGCPSTCVDYVNNNPSAFANAYWDIAALRVYT